MWGERREGKGRGEGREHVEGKRRGREGKRGHEVDSEMVVQGKRGAEGKGREGKGRGGMGESRKKNYVKSEDALISFK